MRNVTLALAGLILLPASALAQPPADAMPLSEILASIENEADFSYFDEIDWDDDGHWEIEYYRADGASVEVDADPVSGQRR